MLQEERKKQQQPHPKPPAGVRKDGRVQSRGGTHRQAARRGAAGAESCRPARPPCCLPNSLVAMILGARQDRLGGSRLSPQRKGRCSAGASFSPARSSPPRRLARQFPLRLQASPLFPFSCFSLIFISSLRCLIPPAVSSQPRALGPEMDPNNTAEHR